jgi:glycosyltransferase involved in cell wall biosynthesis
MSSSLPALSVVVPNYNHGKYLDTSLSAIIKQSLRPIEVLVLDDASTDDSVEIIKRIAAQNPLVRLIQNEKNLGVMPNLNKGLELSCGDYVYIGSADDEVQPGLFEKSLTLLARYPQAAMSCSVSEWHDAASGLRWFMAAGMAEKPCYLSPQELVRLGRRGKLLIVTASAVFKRQPLLEAGRFHPELRWHADWFAAFVPALRYGVCYIPEPLSDFYLYSTSFYNRGRKTGEHFQVLTHLLDKLSSPACSDIAPRIRDSAVLGLFGVPVLRLIMGRREYRQFLTPLLVSRCCRRSGELVAKKLLPRPLAQLALRLLYNQ